jgi:predicted transcriptional regulator
MATSVKTAISLQKDLFNKVNELAEGLHVSRSRLFVMAVEDFIQKQENLDLLGQINKAFAHQPDSEELKLHEEMRRKQLKNAGREKW